MQIIEVIGRIFLSTLFLLEGISKIFHYEGTIEYMENFNVPGYMIIPAIVIEILFPILLIFGYKTKLSAMILCIFSLVVSIIFHINFSDQMQFISLLKNIAIAGGFLIIFVNSPGKYSIDHIREIKLNQN